MSLLQPTVYCTTLNHKNRSEIDFFSQLSKLFQIRDFFAIIEYHTCPIRSA
jgi:hypothetical protein